MWEEVLNAVRKSVNVLGKDCTCLKRRFGRATQMWFLMEVLNEEEDLDIQR